MKKIYTIGHSTYEIKYFIELLKINNINTIVDVRSVPYSRFASQYNKDFLKDSLKEASICYIYMGDMLGARYEDRDLLFDDGKVNFQKIQEIKAFQDGIMRLEKGINKGYTISLMCSEKEAFDCHRFGLISEFLSKLSIDVQHIYPNKVLNQDALEKQLLKKYEQQLPAHNLFNPKMDDTALLKLAYELRNKDIAYNATTKEGDE